MRVKQLVREMIHTTRPEYLASERVLMREFDVSRNTVRRVLNELVQEKLLIAEHGRGYRVLYAPEGREFAGRIGFAMLNDDDVFTNAVFRAVINEVFSRKLEPVVSIIDINNENPTEKIFRLLAATNAVFIHSAALQADAVLPKMDLHRMLELPYPVKKTALGGISADMYKGARMLTRHLIEYGHHKIAALIADKPRQLGFERVMKQHRLTVSGHLQLSCRGYRHPAYAAMGELLKYRGEFTAVICQNDSAALGAMERCFLEGVKVPEEISIVGFDNINDARFFPVPLTTAGIELGAMAKKALNMLLEGLRTGKSQPAVKLKPELIIRSSVRNLNKNKTGNIIL